MNNPPRTSTFAIVSLVAGVLSWMMLPVLAGLVAIIFGHLARAEIRRDRLEGDGMALAGLWLGYLNLALSALMIGALLFGFIGLGLLSAFTQAG